MEILKYLALNRHVLPSHHLFVDTIPFSTAKRLLGCLTVRAETFLVACEHQEHQEHQDHQEHQEHQENQEHQDATICPKPAAAIFDPQLRDVDVELSIIEWVRDYVLDQKT